MTTAAERSSTRHSTGTIESTDAAATAHPVGTTDVAAALRLSTTRLARRLRTEAEIGLTPSLLSALAVIHVRGPLTLGALADLEGVAPPTVTKLVARLQEQGLAERVVDPDDRRVARVSITAAGNTLLAESRARKTEWLASRLSHLDEDQLRTLQRASDLIDALLVTSPEESPTTRAGGGASS